MSISTTAPIQTGEGWEVADVDATYGFVFLPIQLLTGFENPETLTVSNARAVDADGNELFTLNILEPGVGAPDGYFQIPQGEFERLNYSGEFSLEFDVTGPTGEVVTGTTQVATAYEGDTAPPQLWRSQLAELSDADGGTVTFTEAELFSGLRDFSRTADSGVIADVASISVDNGSIVEVEPGVFAYTADAGYEGEVTLSYTVVDGAGNESEVLTNSFDVLNNAAPQNLVRIGNVVQFADVENNLGAQPLSDEMLSSGYISLDGAELSIENLQVSSGSITYGTEVGDTYGTYFLDFEEGFLGEATLTYDIVNGSGESVTVQRTLNVVDNVSDTSGSFAKDITLSNGETLSQFYRETSDPTLGFVQTNKSASTYVREYTLSAGDNPDQWDPQIVQQNGSAVIYRQQFYAGAFAAEDPNTPDVTNVGGRVFNLTAQNGTFTNTNLVTRDGATTRYTPNEGFAGYDTITFEFENVDGDRVFLTKTIEVRPTDYSTLEPLPAEPPVVIDTVPFESAGDLLVIEDSFRKTFHENFLVRELGGFDDSVDIQSIELSDSSAGRVEKLGASEWTFYANSDYYGYVEATATLTNGETVDFRYLRIAQDDTSTIDVSGLGNPTNGRPTPAAANAPIDAYVIQESGKIALSESMLLEGIVDSDGTTNGLEAKVLSVRTDNESGSTALSFEVSEYNGETIYILDDYVTDVDRVIVDWEITDNTNGYDPFILSGFVLSEADWNAQGAVTNYETISLEPPFSYTMPGEEGVDYVTDTFTGTSDKMTRLGQDSQGDYWGRVTNAANDNDVVTGTNYALVAVRNDEFNGSAELVEGRYAISKAFQVEDGEQVYAQIDAAQMDALYSLGDAKDGADLWLVELGSSAGMDNFDSVDKVLGKRFIGSADQALDPSLNIPTDLI